MNRNPDARCENCPYFLEDAGADFGSEKKMHGYCRIRSILPSQVYVSIIEWRTYLYPPRRETDWCGEHPDFFVEGDPCND